MSDSLPQELYVSVPAHLFPLGHAKNPLNFDHAYKVLETLFPGLNKRAYAISNPGNLKVSRHPDAKALYPIWHGLSSPLTPVFLGFETLQEAWEKLQMDGLLPAFKLPWLFPWLETRSIYGPEYRNQPYPETLLDLLSIALYTPEALLTMEELVGAVCNSEEFLDDYHTLFSLNHSWVVYAGEKGDSFSTVRAHRDLRARGFTLVAGRGGSYSLASFIPSVLSFSFPAGFQSQ